MTGREHGACLPAVRRHTPAGTASGFCAAADANPAARRHVKRRLAAAAIYSASGVAAHQPNGLPSAYFGGMVSTVPTLSLLASLILSLLAS